MAVRVCAAVLPVRPGEQQRVERHRRRAVGHHGKATRRPGLSVAGRQSPRGSAALRPHCSLTHRASGRPGASVYREGLSVRADAIGCSGWSGYGVNCRKDFRRHAGVAAGWRRAFSQCFKDAGPVLTTTIKMFEAIRVKFGFDIGLGARRSRAACSESVH